MPPSALRRRFLLSGTMLAAAVGGYGRRAYAACVNSGGSTYQCSGANVTSQSVSGTNASISTLPGFSINTANQFGLQISSQGDLSYTDLNASPLTASGTALYARNFGSGAASLTITTNGALTGGARGIYAASHLGPLTIVTNGNVTGVNSAGIVATNPSFAAGTSVSVTTGAGTTVSGRVGMDVGNAGTGATTITVNGNVIGTGSNGIYARNSATATNLTVTTGPGSTVSGNYSGIIAHNAGTGALTITANGNVAGGSTGVGIDAYNSSAGTTVTVTTGAGTTVSGGNQGISALTFGTGALTITANGNVTGANYEGIYAETSAAALSVTTAAGTTVSGGTNGISAVSNGTGALTISANGNVSGSSRNGIYARNNHGTALTVTTAAGTTVSGGTHGINALLLGTGALTITANGNVSGTSGNGIDARNYGTNLTVTTAAGTTVSGGTHGISAVNNGTGALTINTNGNVTGGIFARNYGTVITVTTAAGTTVSGGNYAIFAENRSTGALTITANGNLSGSAGDGILAVSAGGALAITVGAAAAVSGTWAAVTEIGGAATVTVAGTLNGGAAGAVNFDQTGGFANRLELVTGAIINGTVHGGNGTDTLGLSGTASGSFNLSQLVSFEAGEKTGSGSWTLTGANARIATFSVGGGTLLVNGSLSNAAFTVSGGALGGTGTVGNTLISGGSFAPGSGTPGSFMTVNGTLGFNAASSYAVNLNPATSSFANVSGAATLGGATVNAAWTNGSYIARQYTILTAGSLSGTFNPTVANTNLPANFHDTLSYDATHAYLNLALNFGIPGALNGNQQTVGNALTGYFNSNGTIPMVYGQLSAGGLSQAAGESATGSQQSTFGAMNQFMGVLTDPFIDGRGDGAGAGGGASSATGYASTQKPAAIRDAYAMFTKAPPAVIPFEQRWSVWAAGYGGSQTTDGNAALGSNTGTSRIAGTAVGADYRISPFTIAGFALAGGGTSFSVNGLGSGRSDLFQAGAFMRHNVGPAYLTGALAYGWQDITTDRNVTIAGIDRLHAEFNANAFSGRLEGGYRFVAPVMGGFGITPYAAGQFTTFDLPAYAEQALVGANTFALAYGARHVTDSRSEFGLRTDKSFAMPDGIFTLRGRLAWAHDYDPDRSIGATFQTLPGASFVVNGAAQAANSALVTASVEKKWLTGWSAAATFEGEFSDVSRSYAGKGVVRYQW
jgi:uncharacterized protein with beta-barrel porin domain